MFQVLGGVDCQEKVISSAVLFIKTLTLLSLKNHKYLFQESNLVGMVIFTSYFFVKVENFCVAYEV